MMPQFHFTQDGTSGDYSVTFVPTLFAWDFSNDHNRAAFDRELRHILTRRHCSKREITVQTMSLVLEFVTKKGLHIPEPPCIHCSEDFENHSENKCLYEPTRYEPDFGAISFRNWADVELTRENENTIQNWRSAYITKLNVKLEF